MLAQHCNTLSPVSCTSLSSPPPPKIYSRNRPHTTASACSCHHLVVGRFQTPGPCSGQGSDIPCLSREQNRPTEKRWWGHDKAQSLTLLCAPSTSDESQISPNLRPPVRKFTFNLSGVASHIAFPSPSHTPPTTRPGWTQRERAEMSGTGWSLWVPSSWRCSVILWSLVHWHSQVM